MGPVAEPGEHTGVGGARDWGPVVRWPEDQRLGDLQVPSPEMLRRKEKLRLRCRKELCS